MFERDKVIGVNSNIVRRTKTGFRMPVQKIRVKQPNSNKTRLEYKIPSGSTVMTCLTSDFFLEEADIMRQEAWDFMHERYDCLFQIITKRPERIRQCLPDNWLGGYENVMISVTAENTQRAYERIPILLDIDLKYRGVVIEPMLESMDISPFLSSGIINQVTVGGESYMGNAGKPRELELSWVEDISNQCREYDTNFYFHQTGSRLKLKGGKTIRIKKSDEHNLAQFYRLDYIDNMDLVNWEHKAEEIFYRNLAEQAREVYRQITLEDLMINGVNEKT